MFLQVYALQIYQLEHVMDTKLSQKPGVSRECRDVLLLSLVPRLLQIFDREMTIEKRIRQEITEMKYNTKTWEVDGVQHGSMVRISGDEVYKSILVHYLSSF